MNNAIKHRGPDSEGIYKFENIILGHQRLSILDLSEKGKQPMTNDGKYWIVYNGEIYNFKEIKKQLLDLGYVFYSNTDTEVILCAFKEWGVNSFEMFNGMWSFAILDTIKKKLIISRDRYGVKPCYYLNNSEKFIFSSEIKGLFSSNENIEIDKNKLALTSKGLEKNFTTVYKDINIVPPGFYFEIDLQKNELKKTRWWNSLLKFPKISVNYRSIKETLKELLINATNERLVSDVKIATSLSGGIDSAIIFTILNHLKKNINDIYKIDLNPFIINYDENKTFDEAIKLANFFKKKPIIIQSDEESLENLTFKLSSIEVIDPYFKQLEIYKKQKDHGFKVSIDGHGADECLGGYKKDIENFGMYFQNSIVDLYKTINSLNSKESLKETVKRLNLLNNVHGFKIDLEHFFHNQMQESNYFEYKNIDIMPDFFEDDLKELKNFNFPTQLMYLNATYGQLQWLLNKWDKSSMANSVEIRSPFMDWRFFQYSLALPAELKIKDGQNKSILRESFKNMMPDEVTKIKIKQGLPKVDLQKSSQIINIIKKVLDEKNFKEHNLWDSKKIIYDFKNKEDKIFNINKVWKVVGTYLMTKGFLERKKGIIKSENKIIESFNNLKEN